MKKRIVLTLLIIICLCPSEAFSQAGMDPDELLSSGWIIIEAEHCTIMLHPNVNVNKVYRNTKIRFWDILIEKDYHASKEHAIFESIMENFDRTFQKVEKILDMYPRNMNVKVAIYPNQLLLDGKHYEIFGEENTSDREDAYYVHNHTTIYATQNSISQEVLAHEMGHAIVDHYFLIPPPEKVKELLCQYVELHLAD